MFDTVIRTDFIDSKSLLILREYCDVCEYYINESYSGLPVDKQGNRSFTDKTLLEMGLPPAPGQVLRSHRHSDMIEEIKIIMLKTYSACENMISETYKENMLSFQGGGIVRYQPGQSLPYHRDWTADDKWVVEKNLPTVHLSSVFYINDDYKGGELKLSSQRYGDFKHDIMSLKPVAGSIVFFDALQWHASAPVKNGFKYASTNFYTLENV